MTQRPDLPTYAELRGRYAAAREEAVRATKAARKSEVQRLALEGKVERLSQRIEELQQVAADDRAEARRRRQELADAERDVQMARRLAAERQRDADQAIGIAVSALRRVREDLDRVESSTAWRLGHRAAQTLTRVRLRRPKTAGAVALARERVDTAVEVLAARRGEAAPALPAAAAGAAAPAQIAGILSDTIRNHLGAVPERSEWPGVTAVVRAGEGQEIPAAFFEGLRDTDYPTLELVVAGGAHDGPHTKLELPFPVRTTPAGAGAIAAWNQAASLAEQPLLLFLDPAAQPFEPGWLKELVDGLLADDGAVIAPTVLAVGSQPVQGSEDGGVIVAQRGLRLGRRSGVAVPEPIGSGEDPFGAAFGTEQPCAAAGGRCLLLHRDTLARAGDFDTALRSGTADIGLSLSVTAAGGRVTSSGRSFLLAAGADGEPAADEASLTERWGPVLWRELRLGLGRRDPAWAGGDALHIAVTGEGPSNGDGPESSSPPSDSGRAHEPATELGLALGASGARISYVGEGQALAADLDAVIVVTPELDPELLPPWITAIAWIRDAEDAWLSHSLDRYDILLAATEGSSDAVFAATGRRPVLCRPATKPVAPRPGHFDEPSADFAVTGNPDRAQRSVLRKYERAEQRRSMPPYSLAKVLVDADTGDDGALSSVVLDALASGTPVISANVRSAREQLGEDFPVFTDADELAAQLESLLPDADRRAEVALRYRRVVLAEHTYGQRATRVRGLIAALDEQLSFCLKIGAPDAEQAARWGDLYLARDLERAFKRAGHRCLIQTASDWDDPAGYAYDVAVHLRGRGSYSPRAGQFNVLWVMSHPGELSVEEASGYDLVCVASELFAAELRDKLSVPVAVLDQATDPWRFYPDPDPSLTHDLVFVGNNRGARRPLLDELAPTAHDLAVWGSGLEEMVDRRQLKGEWFPNEDLRRLYSSAKIVLCDHWDEMRAGGFVSNRAYDAVASGAVVVCDAVAGLDDRFGEAVVRCASPEELKQTIDRLVSDDAERQRRTEGARERVLAAHTFDHRAQELLRLVDQHAATSGHRTRVAA